MTNLLDIAANEALIKRALRAKGIDVATVSLYGGGQQSSAVGDALDAPLAAFGRHGTTHASASPGVGGMQGRAAGSAPRVGGGLERGTLIPAIEESHRPGKRLGETRKATISFA